MIIVEISHLLPHFPLPYSSPPPLPLLALTLYQEPTTTRSLCDLRSSERLEQSTNSCGCPETCSTGWRPGRKRPPLTRRPVSVCVVCVCVYVSVCLCVCVWRGGGVNLVKGCVHVYVSKFVLSFTPPPPLPPSSSLLPTLQSSDTELLGEMMFGSMPIKVAGCSIKVHYIRWARGRVT